MELIGELGGAHVASQDLHLSTKEGVGRIEEIQLGHVRKSQAVVLILHHDEEVSLHESDPTVHSHRRVLARASPGFLQPVDVDVVR